MGYMPKPSRGFCAAAVVLALVFAAGAAAQMRGMGHMGGYFRPQVSGISPAELPEPGSAGARLYAHFCARCHALPKPTLHTAAEWPAVAERMFYRMYASCRGPMMGMMPPGFPLPEERAEIVRYLSAHGFKPLAPSDAAAPRTPRAALFAEVCSGCHAPPDPRSYGPQGWPAVLERMRGYMKASGRPLSDDKAGEILGYLQENSSR
ncbi:MAG: hypothetical protein Kow0025_15030 [Thermodesulfovibrionales bacterium]